MADLNSLRALLTESGKELLEAACRLQPKEEDFLRHYQHLSRSHPAALVRTALELAVLRQKGLAKIPFADRLFFTRAALEQASAWEVASYRARRFSGFQTLFDLGCSVGIDTLALASSGDTLGFDNDPLRLAMARANLRALPLPHLAQVACADLLHPLPISRSLTSSALFFDPARRTDTRRIYHVEEYHPPLSVIHRWLETHPNLGVKVSPGVKLEELAGYDCEVEFISLHGELKEAVLWFGSLRSAARRATLLPLNHTLTDGDEAAQPGLLPPLSTPLAYLLEPDAAVIRAGLVQALAHRLNAAQIDRQIAYLTTPAPITSPFVRSWQIETWMPFSLKKLRAYLRSRHVGIVTVKKRGSPLDPEELHHSLRLTGTQERVLFLTHSAGAPIVIIALPPA